MSNSFKAAFSGILTALAVSFMALASVIPIMLYCSPMLAGFCVAVADEEFGVKTAFGVYTASSVLSALLLSDKETAIVFILLGGAYPIVKSIVGKRKTGLLSKPAVRLLTKLLFVNAACIAYYFLALLLLSVPKESFGAGIMAWIMLVCANIIMLCYDRATDVMLALYKIRLRNKIMKGKGR